MNEDRPAMSATILKPTKGTFQQCTHWTGDGYFQAVHMKIYCESYQ